MTLVLQTFNLSKRYKNQWALKDVNMRVNRGDIYGFVGENGSGKTTIIRLISGLISPTNGNFTLFGADSNSSAVLTARKKLGAIVESPSIYLNMSATENLKMQCGILGIKTCVKEKIAQVLSEVGLLDQLDSKKKAGNFSLGMRQRLGIAMALLGEPEFLILDEPMNGLDPAGIVEIRELILKLNKEKGITFLISSHILTELALVATTYGIISKGRIVKEISAEDLKKASRAYAVIETERTEKLFNLVKDFAPEGDYEFTEKGVKVFTEDLTALLKRLLDNGITLNGVNYSTANIEEYYLSLMGGAKNE